MEQAGGFKVGAKDWRTGVMDRESDENNWVKLIKWREAEEEWLRWSWRNESGSCFQRQDDPYRNERSVIFQQKHADDVKYRNVSMGGGCCRALVGGFGLWPETKGDVDQQRIYTAAYRCYVDRVVAWLRALLPLPVCVPPLCSPSSRGNLSAALSAPEQRGLLKQISTSASLVISIKTTVK